MCIFNGERWHNSKCINYVCVVLMFVNSACGGLRTDINFQQPTFWLVLGVLGKGALLVLPILQVTGLAYLTLQQVVSNYSLSFRV